MERAADALLRAGERPTVEKIRASLGGGSPNTVNPLLDAWWKRLAGRLDAGPAALHRLPASVAHITESLWLQALDEGRRRAALELQSETRGASQLKDTYEVRSHVLSLREGEWESRLKDRERTLDDLQSQLRTLGILLQKEQRTREAQTSRIAELESELRRRSKPARLPTRARRQPRPATTGKKRRTTTAKRRTAIKPARVASRQAQRKSGAKQTQKPFRAPTKGRRPQRRSFSFD